MDLKKKKKKLTLQPAAPQGAESDLCDRFYWWLNVVLPLKHIVALLNSAVLEAFQPFPDCGN